MKKSSTAIYLAFILYFAAACATPEFMTRAASPHFNAAVAVFCSVLRLYITSRAAAAILGLCLLFALLSAVLRLFRRNSCLLFPAVIIAKTTLFLLYASLGVAVILVAPFLDKTYFLCAAAILLLTRIAEPVLTAKQNSSSAASPASALFRKASFIALLFAASAIAGAISGRMNLIAISILIAAIALKDNARPSLKISRSRRSFFVLTVVCSLGAHGFINAPPDAWCKSWKPGKDLKLVSPVTDAFDIITADGYLFACFKNGSVIRISPGGGASRITLDAPAQRMAWNSRRNLLYVTAYKSNNPVAIIDPLSFKVIATASVPRCAATSVALSDDESSIFFNCENDYKIIRADSGTGAIIKEKRFPRGTNIYSLAAAGGKVYAISASLDPWLYVLDAKTLSVISRQYTGYGNQMTALASSRDKLFISRTSASLIAVFDLTRQLYEHPFHTGMIVRDVQQISECSLLTADYAAGTAREINICGNNSASRIWRLSPRVRGIWHSEADGKNYAACSCGLYELLK